MYGIYRRVQSLKPTLWRTCRIIANDARLNLLRALHHHGEGTVTALGNLVGLSEPQASLHLRLLNSRGLITARNAGKWVYYSAAANPAVQHTAQILDALKESLADRDTDNRCIIESATSFTHQRRIMIVRQLKDGALTFDELAFRTKISTTSLHRHLNKLKARHIIKSENRFYTLGDPARPLAQTLLQIATAKQ